MELIRGIVAAPVLPMTEEFEVDWKGLRDYLRWLVPQGPTAIAMNMDAAEGPALSVEERLHVVEVSREAAEGSVRPTRTRRSAAWRRSRRWSP